LSYVGSKTKSYIGSQSARVPVPPKKGVLAVVVLAMVAVRIQYRQSVSLDRLARFAPFAVVAVCAGRRVPPVVAAHRVKQARRESAPAGPGEQTSLEEAG